MEIASECPGIAPAQYAIHIGQASYLPAWLENHLRHKRASHTLILRHYRQKRKTSSSEREALVLRYLALALLSPGFG